MTPPTLDHPQRYAGLYAFDFGEWSAFGYTAEEIAMLLESERYRGGRVYRIQRVEPDGRMELRGVSNARFMMETAYCFWRDDASAARDDFERLAALAAAEPPPCRAALYLAEYPRHAAHGRYLTIVILPAEFDDDFARWLSDRQYDGGDLVEGGVSHVTNFQDQQRTILDRRQFVGAATILPRAREEVYAAVRRVAQR